MSSIIPPGGGGGGGGGYPCASLVAAGYVQMATFAQALRPSSYLGSSGCPLALSPIYQWMGRTIGTDAALFQCGPGLFPTNSGNVGYRAIDFMTQRTGPNCVARANYSVAVGTNVYINATSLRAINIGRNNVMYAPYANVDLTMIGQSNRVGAGSTFSDSVVVGRANVFSGVGTDGQIVGTNNNVLAAYLGGVQIFGKNNTIKVGAGRAYDVGVFGDTNTMYVSGSDFVVGKSNRLGRAIGNPVANVFAAGLSNWIELSKSVCVGMENLFYQRLPLAPNDVYNTIIGKKNWLFGGTFDTLIGSYNQTGSPGQYGAALTFSNVFGLSNSIAQTYGFGIKHLSCVGNANSLQSGDYCAVFGYKNSIPANFPGIASQSLVLGYSNVLGNGAFNLSAGAYATVTGSAKSAGFGYKNAVVGGDRSNAFGALNEASAVYGQSFGLYNFANAHTAVAIGVLNNRYNPVLNITTGAISGPPGANPYIGINSAAVGIDNRSSGLRAQAFGFSNRASAVGALTFGDTNYVLGQDCGAFGSSNYVSSAGFTSFAFGRNHQVRSPISGAFGYNNGVSYPVGAILYSRNFLFGIQNFLIGGNQVTVLGEDNLIGTAGPPIAACYASNVVGKFNRMTRVTSVQNGTRVNVFGTSNLLYAGMNTVTVLGDYNVCPANAPATATHVLVAGYSNNFTTGSFNTLVGHNNVFSLSAKSSAFGYYNRITGGDRSFAAGTKNQASAVYGQAVGFYNYANAHTAVALGVLNNAAAGYLNITTGAISGPPGPNAVIGINSSAVGVNNRAEGLRSVAVGFSNRVVLVNGSAFGNSNLVSGQGAAAFGLSCSATATYALVGGVLSVSGGNQSVSLGTSASIGAASHYGVAIGSSVNISAAIINGIVIGRSSTVSQRYGIAVGYGITQAGVRGIAIGRGAGILGGLADGIAIGSAAYAYGLDATAFGAAARATNTKALAVGWTCLASAVESSVFGNYSSAVGYRSTVLGQGCSALVSAQLAFVGGAASSSGGKSSVCIGAGSIVGLNSHYGVLIGSGCYIGTPYVRSVCIGRLSSVWASEAIGIGLGLGISGTRSIAIGKNISVLAGVTEGIAIGVSAVCGAKYAVGIGYVAVAYGQASVAVGRLTYAAQKATAVGYFAAAHAIGSGAFGFSAVVGAAATYAGALGPRAKARIVSTVNLGGPVIVRKDDGETAGNAFWAFNGANVFLFTKEVDLKAVADQTITLPANCHFWVEEVGLVLTTLGGTMVTQPTIRFGITGTPAKFLAATLCALLTAVLKRERFSTLLTDDGETSLVAGVTVAAAGSAAIMGRFYFKGVLVEDE